MSKPTKIPDPRANLLQHYHLVTGQVIFRLKDADTPNLMPLNTVVFDRGRDLPMHMLAKAQQNLQMAFRQRMPDPTLVVLDVVFTGFSYLGHMTTAEFGATPPGTKLESREPLSDLEMLSQGTKPEGTA